MLQISSRNWNQNKLSVIDINAEFLRGWSIEEVGELCESHIAENKFIHQYLLQ